MKKEKILVIGGSGYIGSVVTKKLCNLNYNVTVLDNLSKGLKRLIDKRAEFVKGYILNWESKLGLKEMVESTWSVYKYLN